MVGGVFARQVISFREVHSEFVAYTDNQRVICNMVEKWLCLFKKIGENARFNTINIF